MTPACRDTYGVCTRVSVICQYCRMALLEEIRALKYAKTLCDGLDRTQRVLLSAFMCVSERVR
jgi:hypothetical protein